LDSNLTAYTRFATPLGDMTVTARDGLLRDVLIGREEFEKWQTVHRAVFMPDLPELKIARRQFGEYFSGKRTGFQLPFQLEGTPFQIRVWKALHAIPYGETKSYTDVARAVGNPKAVRAVGQATRRNRLAIVVPCHRVIGKDGSLTGYAGDRIEWKQYLLELEKRTIGNGMKPERRK
jgi:O-6-methylguanine DNA methyltransferase